MPGMKWPMVRSCFSGCLLPVNGYGVCPGWRSQRPTWKTTHRIQHGGDQTSTTYKDVNGTTYNVTLDPENMTLDVKYRKAAGGVLRYDVTWSLRQV